MNMIKMWFKHLEVYCSKKIEENPTKVYYIMIGMLFIIMLLNGIMISYRNFL